MITDGNQLVTLVAESLFAVLFLRALWAYVHSRDTLQRDAMLTFLGTAAVRMHLCTNAASGTSMSYGSATQKE